MAQVLGESGRSAAANASRPRALWDVRFDPTPPRGRPRVSRSTVVRLGIAVVVILAIWVTVNVFVDVDQDDLETTIDRAGIWAPIAYAVILLLGLTVPFNPVSDLLTITVAAIMLHPLEAILATFVAQASSVTINYLIAARYGGGVLDRLEDQPKLSFLNRLRENIDLRTVFVLRLALPLTAIGVDFVSYLAGMKRLNFPGYFLVSLVPWTVMSVAYFTSAGFLRDESPFLVLVPAGIIIAASSLLVVVLKRRHVFDSAPVTDE